MWTFYAVRLSGVILMWSNKYISIPFADHGRSKQGADCWGLARIIYKEELGIDLPTLLDYENIKDGKSIAQLYEKEHIDWQEVKIGDEQPYDILVFKILGFPTHIGIVIDKGVMIHCEYGIGTHVSEYYKDFSWNKRLVGVYRYGK